jgi:hypothetical protein
MEKNDLDKLEFASAESDLPAAEDQVEAIVKVTSPGYVPKGVKLRARVDEQLFTASFPGKLLPALNDDPNVEAVSLSKRLRSPAPPGPERRGNG